MGLDNIKLSPFLMKELYEKDLVENDAIKKPILTSEKAKDSEKAIEDGTIKKEIIGSIKYLGKNEKNILLLIHRETHAFLDDDALSFLMSILNACGLSMQDVALVNVHNDEDAVYEKLNAQFEPSKIIFFDTAPHLLNFPVKIPMYKIQHYNNQLYLCAASLSTLIQNKAEKTQLWTCLKIMLEL
jgi:hypothetical protein